MARRASGRLDSFDPQEDTAIHIVIAGAGIGGLAAALHLSRCGHQVTVLERVEELRPVGAGIVLALNAMANLRPLGVLPRLLERGARIDVMTVCTERGRALTSSVPNQMLFGEPIQAIGIHRGALHEVLVDAARAANVELRLGAEVERFEQTTDSVRIEATGPGAPARLEADLLIGADGLHSSVRRQLHGPSETRFSGQVCWRGVVREDFGLGGQATEAWGRSRRIGIVPIGENQAYWFAVVTAEPGFVPPDGSVAEYLERHFASFSAPTLDILRATDPASMIQTDIVDRPPLTRWGSGRVTLLGDAAHPMTPNLGQGAGQAIEDAGFLAYVMQRQPTAGVPGLIQAYETLRIPRTAAIVRQSLTMGKLAQLDNGLLRALRDLALRCTPASVPRNAYAKLLAEGVPPDLSTSPK